MRKIIKLSNNKWTLCGYAPMSWRLGFSMECGSKLLPEIDRIPVKVPGSVQKGLLDASIIKDWNYGINGLACEWVENRDWLFETVLPEISLKENEEAFLCFEGLDGSGAVMLNAKEAGRFENSFIPYEFNVSKLLSEKSENRLLVAFEPPPRWLGQIAETSKINQMKTRFYYTWDWIARMVQTGIWDEVRLEIRSRSFIESARCLSSYSSKSAKGRLDYILGLRANEHQKIRIDLQSCETEKILVSKIFNADKQELSLEIDRPDLWMPNGHGNQALYRSTVSLINEDGKQEDSLSFLNGFREIRWEKCRNSAENADPWICNINGKPIFLQGFNWTPIRANFADLSREDSLKRLNIYKDMGCNILRIWGGAVLEKESFYEDCDRLGLMIIQEFPLSSSGLDNWPPEDEYSIKLFTETAATYVCRRQHHPALILWCGGNELQGSPDGGKKGCGKPLDKNHPLIRSFDKMLQALDPERRFLETSPSGPRAFASEKDYGQGLHWDVHGPWRVIDENMQRQKEYWSNDDALIRTEAGCPGASSSSLIKKYAGELDPLPISLKNPLWSRISWWYDLEIFVKENGHEPENLEEYVKWSQTRQAEALAIAAESAKQRFPSCGGFLVWMGHDAFPCTVNTSVIDFEGNLKPAAEKLKEIFLRPV